MDERCNRYKRVTDMSEILITYHLFTESEVIPGNLRPRP